MNATVKPTAARHHHQILWRFPQFSATYLKQRWLLIALFVATFISAFAVVFVSAMNYQMVSQQQQLLTVRQQLHNQWSELLLQQGQVSNQAEVVARAEQALNMQMPTNKHVVILPK